MRLSRFGIVTLALFLSIGVASAGNLSFTGIFTQDDQLELFQFTAPSASVVLRTWSYAGGVNANGQIIAPGGFDPILSVFDATGGLLSSSLLVDTNNDGVGVDTDPVTGNAYDSLLALTSLNAGGTYVLVLSQNDNSPNGTTYGDGFSQAGAGNFTPGEFGCAGSDPFCENPFVPQRTGSWAVDISGVRSAADITNNGGDGTAAPEPSSMLLFCAGFTSLALLRRRGKQA